MDPQPARCQKFDTTALAGMFAGYIAELSINNDEWLNYVVATVIGAASLAAGVLRRLDTGE